MLKIDRFLPTKLQVKEIIFFIDFDLTNTIMLIKSSKSMGILWKLNINMTYLKKFHYSSLFSHFSRCFLNEFFNNFIFWKFYLRQTISVDIDENSSKTFLLGICFVTNNILYIMYVVILQSCIIYTFIIILHFQFFGNL